MYLVLDFDGVMELTPIWRKPEFMDDGFYLFDETSRLNLIEIIKKLDPILVISSSHKSYMPESKLLELMNNREIFPKELIKLNKRLFGSTQISRAQELMEWVEINDPEEYLILDDDPSVYVLPQEILDNTIKIDPTKGITNEVLTQILMNYERKKSL